MSTFAPHFTHLLRTALALAVMAGCWLSAADGTGLVGTYFSTQGLTGTRVVRTDATVDFAWGGASPVAGIGADHFSVRWTGQVQALTTESVTFYTVSDDGVRLFVNGTLLIDQWNDHGATEHQGSIALVTGQHYDIRMEFYENGGDAVAKLLWSSASIAKQVVPQARLYPSMPVGTGSGVLATYYDNSNFTGVTAMRTDATVNFDWAGGSPVSGIAADTFSVRWVGEVEARHSETFTFATTTDDGVRLWIGGQLVVNHWSDQSATERTGTIALVAGVRYPLIMEFYENGGAAVATLSWSSPSTPKEIIPSTQLYPIAPVGTGTGLLATYFDNQGFTGTTIERTDATVNFDWAGASPDPTIAVDTFSARWTGEVEPRTSETYTFTTTSDDGVRLWVDGQLLIDQWNDHGATEHQGTIALTAGKRAIVVMEFYEAYGAAVAKLAWSTPTIAKAIIPTTQLYPAAAIGTGSGLLAQYFDERDLSGPAQTRVDATVDFDWGTGSPLSGINPDTFSVRWSGEVEPRHSETYSFRVTSDDGVRLWVGGNLLIDQWNDHAPRTDQATIALIAGHRYPIVLEYYENAGGAVAKLGWSSPSTPVAPIPSTQLYPAAAIGTGTGLLATYFDQPNFAGPGMTRIDATVDFDWAGGSPASAIAPDTFSVRWVGEVQALFSETVTFQTLSDDGVRVSVGGQLLIDQWNDHGAATHSVSISLVAGQRYPIVMEFYENGGDAVARLRWTSSRLPLQAVPQSQLYPALIPGTGTGLAAAYFDNPDFSGTTVTRIDPMINFDWSGGSPVAGIAPDTFSVRWLGEVQPFVSETHTFTTISDDGIRVWIGEQLVIDHWSDHAATARSGTIALVGGQRYPLRVDFYENGGAAVSKLLWSSPSTPAGVVPTSQLYPVGIHLLPKVAMTATAAAEGGSSGNITFSIPDPQVTDTVITYTIGGTATAGSDYVATPLTGSVTILANTLQTVVTVVAVDDADVEGTETVTFTLVADPAYVIAMPSTVTVAITDNDQSVPSPVVSVTATDSSAAESGPDIGRLTLSRAVVSSSPLTVRYTVGGTATPSEDYVSLSGSVIIAGGAVSVEVDIVPIDDQLVESAETAILSIDVDQAYTVGSPSTATVTITSDDVPLLTAPTVTTTAVTGITQSGATSGGTVTSDGGASVTARGICWSTSANPSTADTVIGSGTGTGPFTSALSGLVVGTTYHVRAYATNSVGTAYGTDVTFSTLSAPTVATAPAADLNPVTGTKTHLTVLGADDGGEGVLTYAWSTTGVPPASVSFSANGTNSAKNTTATFAKAGVYDLQVVITDSSNLSVTSSVVVNVVATITDIVVTPPTVSVAPGGTIQFTAVASDQFGIAMNPQPNVNWSVSAGGGSVSSGGLVTAPATSGQFSVTASSGTASDDSTYDTQANLPEIVFAMGTSSVSEGDGQVAISVTLSQSTTQAVTVAYAVTGTATGGGDDYFLPNGVLTVASGTTSASMPLSLRDDSVIESDETVLITLSSPTNSTLGSSSVHTLTISDNDAVTVQVVASDPNASEAAHFGAVTFTRTGSLVSALPITFTVTGTATKAVDFVDIGPIATFAAGSAAMILPIIAVQDDLQEAPESVVVTLGSGSYELGASTSATVTIADDDVVVITAAPTTTSEGESPTPAKFIVSRAGSTAGDLVVNVGFSGTATSEDYVRTPSSGAVTIGTGQTSAEITITPHNDVIAEGNETVVALLETGSNYTIGTQKTGILTILDDEVPTVIVAATTASASEPSTPGVFTITRSSVASTALDVLYEVSGTAAMGADFTVLTGTATIPASTMTTTLTIVPTADDISELGETITLTLKSQMTYNVGVANSATVIIADCTVTLSALDANAAEPGGSTGTGAYIISRTGGTDSALTVNVAWEGSATYNLDYSSNPTVISVVTIPAGSVAATVAATPLPDTQAEGDEIAVLALRPGSYAIGSSTQGSVTIRDATLTVNVDRTTISEAGGAFATFRITRTGNLADGLSVPISWSGTASTVTSPDYFKSTTAVSVFIPPGSATAEVRATTVNDDILEEDESITLTIGTVGGYALTPALSATTSIVDDEFPTVRIYVTDGAVAEAGLDSGVFTITSSTASTTPLQVNVIRGGTAAMNIDVNFAPSLDLASTTLEIPAFETSVNVVIHPLGDMISEGVETVTLAIAPGAGYRLGDASGTLSSINIADDDTPVLSVATTAANATEGESNGSFTITRIGNLNSDLTAAISFVGSTAGNGSDFTVIPTAILLPSGMSTISVYAAPIEDMLSEGDESVQLTLSAGAGYNVGLPASAIITIHDNDAPTVSIFTEASAVEQSSPIVGTFSLHRTGGTNASLPIAVAFTGAAGTGDYTIAPSNISMPSGLATIAITITPLDDQIAEGDETVTATILPGLGYTAGTASTATLAISDDERPMITIAATDAKAGEAGGNTGTFTISRSATSGISLTIPYAITGTAKAGTDYLQLTGSVTIAPGSSSALITITPRDDAEIEYSEGVTITLMESVNYDLVAPARASCIIFSDDLPPPRVAFTKNGNLTASLYGEVPVGYAINELIASSGDGSVTMTGSISGALFTATAQGQFATSTEVTLRYRNADGQLSPASSQIIQLDISGSGESGSTTGLPSDVPRVTITITPASLTGDKTGSFEEKITNFTSKGGSDGSKITISVSAESTLFPVTEVRLRCTDGREFSGSGSSLSEQLAFPREGLYTFEAEAIVDNNGYLVVGTTTEPTRLMIDRTPPQLIFRADPIFWQDPTIPEFLPTPPATISFEDGKTRDTSLLHFTAQIYLNNNPESGITGNKALRKAKGWHYYRLSDFKIRVEVLDDLYCEEFNGEYPSATPSGLTIQTINVNSPRDGLILSNFSSTTQLLSINVRDQAGNQSVPDRSKLNLSYSGDPTIHVFGDNDLPEFTFSSPLRAAYLGHLWHPEAWQGSVGKAGRLLPSGFSGRTWDLATDIDLSSNIYKINKNDQPDYTPNNQQFILRDEHGNLKNFDYKFALAPAILGPSPQYQFGRYLHGESPHSSSGTTFCWFLENLERWPDDPTDFSTYYKTAQTAGIGLQDIKFSWSPANPSPSSSPYPSDIASVTIAADNSVPLPQYDDFGYTENHEIIASSPIYPGANGPNRRFGPVIVSIPPPWAETQAPLPFRIRDEGLVGMKKGVTYAQAWAGPFPVQSVTFKRTDGAISGLLTVDRPASAFSWKTNLGYHSVGYSVDAFEPSENETLRPYHGGGDRWFSVVRLENEKLLAGTTATIRVIGGFIDREFSYDDFNPLSASYVRFFKGSNDITLPISGGDTSNSLIDDKIKIISQKLIAAGSQQMSVQVLEVQVQVGANVNAGLYHLDVNCGAIKAYSDALSAAYAGANGAHRMKEALYVYGFHLEQDNGDGNFQPGFDIERNRPTVTISTPYDGAKISASSSYSGITLQVAGSVSDYSAKLTGVNPTLIINGQSMQLSGSGPDFSFSGSVTLINTNVMRATATNVFGVKGTREVYIGKQFSNANARPPSTPPQAPGGQWVYAQQKYTISSLAGSPLSTFDLTQIDVVTNQSSTLSMSYAGSTPNLVDATPERVFLSADGTTLVRVTVQSAGAAGHLAYLSTIISAATGSSFERQVEFIQTAIGANSYASQAAEVRLSASASLSTSVVDIVSASIYKPFTPTVTATLTETGPMTYEFTDGNGTSVHIYGPDVTESPRLVAVITCDPLSLNATPILVASQSGTLSGPTFAANYLIFQGSGPSNDPGAFVYAATTNNYPDLLPIQRAKRLVIDVGHGVGASTLQITGKATSAVLFTPQGNKLISEALAFDPVNGGAARTVTGWPIKWEGDIAGDEPKPQNIEDDPDIIKIGLSVEGHAIPLSLFVRRIPGPVKISHGEVLSGDVKVSIPNQLKPGANAIEKPQATFFVEIDDLQLRFLKAVAATWDGAKFSDSVRLDSILNGQEIADLAKLDSMGFHVDLSWKIPLTLSGWGEAGRGFAAGALTEVVDTINPLEILRSLIALASINWSEVDALSVVKEMFIGEFKAAMEAANSPVEIIADVELGPRNKWYAWGYHSGKALVFYASIPLGAIAGPKIARKLKTVLKTHRLVVKPEILGTFGGNIRWVIKPYAYATINPANRQRSFVEVVVHKGSIKQPDPTTGEIARSRITVRDEDIPGYGGQRLQHDRGHLVADSLGGRADIPNNFVTMWLSPNRGVMRVFEKGVYDLANANKLVVYRVTPLYNLGPDIPSAIKLEAWVNGVPVLLGKDGLPQIFDNIPPAPTP